VPEGKEEGDDKEEDLACDALSEEIGIIDESRLVVNFKDGFPLLRTVDDHLPNQNIFQMGNRQT